MNQSGGSPSDIKSPPLLLQTITASKTTNTLSQIEHRPTSLYTSSYRPHITSATSNNSKFTSNDISQTIANNNSHSDKDASTATSTVNKWLSDEINDDDSLKAQSVSKESKVDTSSRTKENANGVSNDTKKDSMKTKLAKEYTEIERIEVPSLSMPQSKQVIKSESVRVGKKTESSTDPPEHSSEDDDESSDTTSTDSYSECSEASNECAKIDFGDEGGVDEEGKQIFLS